MSISWSFLRKMKFNNWSQVMEIMKKLLQSVAFNRKYFHVYDHVPQGGPQI